MWQTPSKKARPFGKASAARSRTTRAQPRMRLRRTHAQVKILMPPASVVTDARLLLNEISPNGLSLFCAAPVNVGVEVAITMEDPTRVYVRGRVVSCLEYESSQHVMSTQTYHYRVGVMFLFDTPAERSEFKRYVDSLSQNFLNGAQLKVG